MSALTALRQYESELPPLAQNVSSGAMSVVNAPLGAKPFSRPRRWNYFKDRLIERFGEVVYKIGVDAGFDCPNRDGTKAYGGCAYCSQSGSLSPHQEPNQAIAAQIAKGRWFIQKRYGAEKFIVYYQAFTNTYAAVNILRERYEASFKDLDDEARKQMVGLSIATRPDCINEENIVLLKEYSERFPYFTIELGLQSAHQNRLEWVNRQETVEDYYRAMKLLKAFDIDVISHVILGFPGEREQEMRETVQIAEECGSRGLKLQMLHVIKNTKLAVMHSRSPLNLLSMEEYGELVISLIERIHPQVEIHRITGETHEAELVAPEWVRHKTRFFDWFEGELERRNTYQGRLKAPDTMQHNLNARS